MTDVDVEIWPCTRHRPALLADLTPWTRAYAIATRCPNCRVVEPDAAETSVVRPGDVESIATGVQMA